MSILYRHSLTNALAHLCFLVAPKLREDSGDTLSLRITNGTQSVSGIRTDHEAGDIGDYKSDTSAAYCTCPGPPGSVPFYFWAKELIGVSTIPSANAKG